jgi:hypothetical protein
MKYQLKLQLKGFYEKHYGFFRYSSRDPVSNFDGSNRITGKEMFDTCDEKGLVYRKKLEIVHIKLGQDWRNLAWMYDQVNRVYIPYNRDILTMQFDLRKCLLEERIPFVNLDVEKTIKLIRDEVIQKEELIKKLEILN